MMLYYSEQVLCWHLPTNFVISLSDQDWCPVPIRASGQVQPAAEVSLGLGKGIHSFILLLLWGHSLGFAPQKHLQDRAWPWQRCLWVQVAVA